MHAVRRWLRAFFCPSAWVAVDPAPDLRQERIALAHQPQRGAAPSGAHEGVGAPCTVEDEDGGCRTRAAAPTAPRWITGEVPPMTAAQADRLLRDVLDAPVTGDDLDELTARRTHPGTIASLDQHRAAHVSRDGIPYDVETAADPEDFERMALSAWPGLRQPWTGSADDERMADLGILVPGVNL